MIEHPFIRKQVISVVLVAFILASIVFGGMVPAQPRDQAARDKSSELGSADGPTQQEQEKRFTPEIEKFVEMEIQRLTDCRFAGDDFHLKAVSQRKETQ